MTWSHVFFHWVFLSSVPGSGQLGALPCGQKRGGVPSWSSPGQGRAAERPEGLAWEQVGGGEWENRRGLERGRRLYLSRIPGPTVGPAQPLALLFLEGQAEVRGRKRSREDQQSFQKSIAFQERVSLSGNESLSDPGHYKLEISPFWRHRVLIQRVGVIQSCLAPPANTG